MAQQAGQSAGSGKNPLGITAFWPSKCTEAPMLWEHWITRFTWGVIAKHSFNPTAFYFDRTLTAEQITDLSEEVNGKNRLEAEQTIISNLYLCLGERGQDRKPHLDLATTQYPRVLDEFESVFRSSGRKETKRSRRTSYYLENNVTGKRWKNFTPYLVDWPLDAHWEHWNDGCCVMYL